MSADCARAAEPRDDGELATVHLPMGATICAGPESGASAGAAVQEMCEKFDGLDTGKSLERCKFAVADGAGSAQGARESLEAVKELQTGYKWCLGILGIVCLIHVLHDGFLK